MLDRIEEQVNFLELELYRFNSFQFARDFKWTRNKDYFRLDGKAFALTNLFCWQAQQQPEPANAKYIYLIPLLVEKYFLQVVCMYPFVTMAFTFSIFSERCIVAVRC